MLTAKSLFRDMRLFEASAAPGLLQASDRYHDLAREAATPEQLIALHRALER